MNVKIHHMWNETRDRTRGSDDECEHTTDSERKENRLTLRDASTDPARRRH